MTIRSGLRQSFTALPSLKNSGLDTTSNSKFSFLFFISFSITALTFFPVPTGTVDLLTITLYEFICWPISFATDNTALKSALPSSAAGVPTAIKITSDSVTAFSMSVVNFILLAFWFLCKSSISPGS